MCACTAPQVALHEALASRRLTSCAPNTASKLGIGQHQKELMIASCEEQFAGFDGSMEKWEMHDEARKSMLYP